MRTGKREVVKETDANNERQDKDEELSVVVHANCTQHTSVFAHQTQIMQAPRTAVPNPWTVARSH